MRKCPNCGQPASRTRDWACQWCGYPLLANGYREIDKTFEELKAGGLRGQRVPVVEKVEESPPPVQVAVPPAAEPEPVVEAVTEPVPEPEPEPVKKAVRKPRQKAKPKAKPKREAKPKVERKKRSRAEPAAEAEVEPAAEAEVEAKAEAEPVPTVKPDPNAILLTVEEMHSAFKGDSAAAEARFAGKVLNVTGLVSIISVDDTSDNPCLILTGANVIEMRNVVCSFDKEYGPVLSRLAEGQRVTVQGTYNSRTVNILLMVDCVLVG